MAREPLPRVRCRAATALGGRCRRLAPVDALGWCHRHWPIVAGDLLRALRVPGDRHAAVRGELRGWLRAALDAVLRDGGPVARSGPSAVQPSAPGPSVSRALEPGAAPSVVDGSFGALPGDMASREPTPRSRRLRGTQPPLAARSTNAGSGTGGSSAPDGDRECTPEEEAEYARLLAEVGIAP